jgi:FkbM family methyltransferase
MTSYHSALIGKIKSISKISRGNRLGRFFYSPIKYLTAILFNHFIYPSRQKGHFVSATTFFGKPIRILLPAATDIYIMGAKSHDSELRLCAYLCKHVTPGTHFLDVGAHIGFYSLLAAHLTGTKGKILSIEPSIGTFELLTQNTIAYPQIEICRCALGEEEGSVQFFEFPVLYSEYNSSKTEHYKNEKWFKEIKPIENQVSMRKLDAIIKEKSVLPNFIKIDAEGSEDLVILGGLAYLSIYSPVVIMEYLQDQNKNHAHQRAHQLLSENGYRVFVSGIEGNLNRVENINPYFASTNIDSENFIYIKG